MLQSWPKVDETLIDTDSEAQMELMMEVIKAIRNMRAELNVAPGKKSPALLQVANDELAALFDGNCGYLKTLAAIDELTIGRLDDAKPEHAMTAVANGVEIYLPIGGLIDVPKETQRLQKELDSLQKEIARVEGKLSNAGFLAKAPADVVEKEKVKADEYKEKYQSIQERIAYLASL